jgi:hypothetical protein
MWDYRPYRRRRKWKKRIQLTVIAIGIIAVCLWLLDMFSDTSPPPY